MTNPRPIGAELRLDGGIRICLMHQEDGCLAVVSSRGARSLASILLELADKADAVASVLG